MKNCRIYAAMIGAIIVLAFPLPATAAGGVNDPGFSYVDVNNDGLYSAADGDIGLLSFPSVDIDLLIENDGKFDTSQSEGAYHAPCYPVSLVITGAMPHGGAFPLNLKAGVNLIVHAPPSAGTYGSLTAPTITLQACRNIDLTDIDSEYVTQMTVQAGCTVILDGAVVTGSDPLSTLNVTSGGNISAKMTGSGITALSTSVLTGTLVSWCANGCIFMDNAAITAYQTTASISLTSGGALQAVDNSTLVSGGDITARSRCSQVQLENDSLTSDSLHVCANCDANVTSSTIVTNGVLAIQANGNVIGNSSATAFTCGSLTVNACHCVDLSSSIITATTADIEVVGRSNVTADSVNWFAQTGIAVTSTCGNIYARTARMAVNLLGPITFYAGGCLIDVTGSVFVGTVSYGPNGVHVIGP